MKGASYVVVDDKPGLIVIRDVGPWDHYATVTNAPEGVVAELYGRGVLPTGKMLLYYDSENCLDQIRHDGQGGFMFFAAAPKEIVPERQVGTRQVEPSEGEPVKINEPTITRNAEGKIIAVSRRGPANLIEFEGEGT